MKRPGAGDEADLTHLSPKERKQALKKRRKEDRRDATREATDSSSGGVADEDTRHRDRLCRQVANLLKANKTRKEANKIAGRVSLALEKGNWSDALTLLIAMRHLAVAPRLGTLQRWVACLGDGTTEDATALGLLYAMLRACPGLGWDLSSVTSTKPTQEDVPKGLPKVTVALSGILRLIPDWEAVPLSSVRSEEELKDYKGLFRVLTTIPGPERTPPNRYDLIMYESLENCTSMLLSDNGQDKLIEKHPVPFVPGAFVLSNVLSVNECAKFIAMTESLGFVPDEPVERTAKLVAATPAGLSDRAANLTILADGTADRKGMMDIIFERCRPMLPETLLDGAQLVGANMRWRLYRYFPGAVYRPHLDGAWPESGRDSSGGYSYDVSNGAHRSRFTFLLYLNEGFKGGCTTFFTPNDDEEGVVEARGVLPRVGSVLVFQHGAGQGSLAHEGSAVTEGSKYILRSDVLYTVPNRQEGRDKSNKL